MSVIKFASMLVMLASMSVITALISLPPNTPAAVEVIDAPSGWSAQLFE